MPRYAKVIADVIYRGFFWVFGRFFADVLSKQTEKFWNRLGNLLPMYLAPEFRRLNSELFEKNN